MSERCGNCKWWYPLDAFEIHVGNPVDNFGECRRYPPVGEIGQFPATEDGMFCGEWCAEKVVIVDPKSKPTDDDYLSHQGV